MTRSNAPGPVATVADLLAIPPEERFHEVIAGELVPKASPTGEHGDAQSAIATRVKGPYQRRPGHGGPGGWWIYTEVEVELEAHEIYRPDVVGWRRDHVPSRPTGTPIAVRPDCVCEIISPSRAADDTVRKLRCYQRAGVPHYWLVDPRDETLSVMRLSADGYVLVLRAERGERVRAEPFSEIELVIAELFGADPD